MALGHRDVERCEHAQKTCVSTLLMAVFAVGPFRALPTVEMKLARDVPRPPGD